MTPDSDLPHVLAPEADRGAIAAHLARPDSGWVYKGRWVAGSLVYAHATATEIAIPPDDGTHYRDDDRHVAEAIHVINACALNLPPTTTREAVSRLAAIVRQYPDSPAAFTAAGRG